MRTTTELIMISGMVAVTFGVRYAPMILVGRVDMPQRLFKALRYVPVAVLTAISVPAVLLPQGTLDIGPGNAYLFGSIAAILIAWRTKNLLYTIGGGMAVFLLWRVIFGV